ncbi:uncharacterized protein LOC132196959 [Neocloeon triangulifer]|uniref:uncharacterized protein LOC132196959 n=1 Tax=Neocloeon triangulifer TaxID=2078957 RepID=UPI00286FA7A2|nr:uncharacterized protein LOC132196959 [Neocloeon triangulifer]
MWRTAKLLVALAVTLFALTSTAAYDTTASTNGNISTNDSATSPTPTSGSVPLVSPGLNAILGMTFLQSGGTNASSTGVARSPEIKVDSQPVTPENLNTPVVAMPGRHRNFRQFPENGDVPQKSDPYPPMVVVEQSLPPIKPLVMPPTPEVLPSPLPLTGAKLGELPDNVDQLKEMVRKRDDANTFLNSRIAEVENKCNNPGPIGIMPSIMPMCKCPPANDESIGCAQVLKMKDDEMENLRERVRVLESRECGNTKQKKNKLEIIVQQKKSNNKKSKKSSEKVVATTDIPTKNNDKFTACSIELDQEKSVTQALQQGIMERDVTLTSLQEMLKNAEQRVSIIQNAEVSACEIKMANIKADLANCKDEKNQMSAASFGRVSRPLMMKYVDEDDELDDDDDDDCDDCLEEDDKRDIMKMVAKLMTGTVVSVQRLPLKMKKRVENKIPIVTFGEKEYYFFNGWRFNWNQANKECEKRNMRLVSIDSEDENAMLFKEINNTKVPYWTGGRETSGKGDFQWAPLKWSFGFTNWGDGQPSYDGRLKSCVQLASTSSGAPWNVDNCNKQMNFICEKQIQPTQSSYN